MNTITKGISGTALVLILSAGSGCSDDGTLAQNKETIQAVLAGLCSTAQTALPLGGDAVTPSVVKGLQVGCILAETAAANITSVTFDTAEQQAAFELKYAASVMQADVPYTLKDGTQVELTADELAEFKEFADKVYFNALTK